MSKMGFWILDFGFWIADVLCRSRRSCTPSRRICGVQLHPSSATECNSVAITVAIILCVCLIGLTGCGTQPSSPETAAHADAAESPLPQRVLPRPPQATPAQPPDYGVIGERNLFQPQLLKRRQKPNSERANPLPPAAPLVAPLPPITPAPSSTEQNARETEPHPLTGWRVVGVIIADGRQAAWLEDAKHQTVWVEVGTTVAGGQKVVAIEASGVTVRDSDGQEVVLQAQPMQGMLSKSAGQSKKGQPFERRIIRQP